MRRVPTLFLPVAVFLAVACGGDGSGDDSHDPTEISNRDAPTATSAQVQDLANVPVPGYSAEGRGDTVLGAAVTYLAAAKTAGGADLMVRVNIAPCDDFVCKGLDPAEYRTPDVQENLKSILPSVHKENPALRWEFGEVKLSSTATGLYYYALSYVETKTSDGGTSRASANSYRAWYHNGGAYLTLEVFSRSPAAPLSLPDLEKTMTKAEAEKAAKEVFAALEPKLPK